MKTSERLFEAVKDIWNSYNTHPFVSGIGNGSLDKEKFKFYMVQDYLYLLDYSKVFALGIIKAKKEEHMRMFADLVSSTLNVEMNTHKQYMQRLGITENDVKTSKASLITESYTKYMLAIGSNEGIAEVATAVMACSWSYKLIADYLEKINGSKYHEFYGEWICSYASDEFRNGNEVIMKLVDDLTVDYTEEQLVNLEDIIINCSRFEYKFWDMSWNKEM